MHPSRTLPCFTVPVTLALSLAVVLVACGGSETGSDGPADPPATARPGATAAPGGTDPVADGPCPVAAVPVTVSVDPWGDIVSGVGGSCVEVTTVVTGAAGDPHDFEPSPADVAAFGRARLVVVNGLGFDPWASSAVEETEAAVVEVAAAGGAGAEDNPHRWYDPADVEAAGTAVSGELRRILPGAEAYLDARAAAWEAELSRWTDLVAEVRGRHEGRTFAATEPVLGPLADALGLTDATPPAYADADHHHGDPSPGAIAAFRSALADGDADVLVYNAQTEGAVPGQLRQAATDAGVPVVEVTETMTDDQPSFVAWQVDLLRRLDDALGRSAT